MNTTTFRLLLDEPIDRDMNSSEQAWLMNVTVLCPAEGGRVVHKARELYHQFINDTIFFDDDSLCIVPSLRMSSSNVEKYEEDNHVTIYPNPASDILSIKYHFQECGNYKFNIIDVTNRLQLKRELTACEGVETINISSLQQGSYFLVIHRDNQIIFAEKLIVIR